MKITLKKSIKVNEKDLKVLNFNLDNITAGDMVKAEETFVVSGARATVPMSLNSGYCLSLAAYACKIPYEDILKLCAQDATKLVGEIQSFLMDLEVAAARS